MKVVEKLKLQIRANKYKTKNDIGGIRFLFDSIKKGQTCFDIGAHKAGYLYWMLQLAGETGKVVAFEPQSFLFEYITNLKKTLNWKNVTVEHLALSDSIGKSELFIPLNKTKKHSSPGATLLPNINKSKIAKTEIVQTQTLDSFCKINKLVPDFLKIDVEGNELNVIKGGIEIISEYKPKLLVEIEERHAGKEKVLETLELFDTLGYTGHFIHQSVRKEISLFSLEKYQNENKMPDYCNNFTFV